MHDDFIGVILFTFSLLLGIAIIVFVLYLCFSFFYIINQYMPLLFLIYH